jgi:hypothetical protein
LKLKDVLFVGRKHGNWIQKRRCVVYLLFGWLKTWQWRWGWFFFFFLYNWRWRWGSPSLAFFRCYFKLLDMLIWTLSVVVWYVQFLVGNQYPFNKIYIQNLFFFLFKKFEFILILVFVLLILIVNYLLILFTGSTSMLPTLFNFNVAESGCFQFQT